VKTSQQLKLSNFVKRKGDNNYAVTDVSRQSKSSSINDVEIVHAIPASKACNLRVKPKASVFYALNYLAFTLLSSAKMTITKIESMTENYPEFPVANLNYVGGHAGYQI
jgi:hypothetical protein